MTTPVLTASNRCDKCSARAYVRVEVLVPDKGKDCELLFCGHHFSIHEPALLYSGARVDDQRQLLAKEEALA